MKNKLLTRDNFREGVFSRDGYKCIFCDKPAEDAHHILERRLFPDGGYYLDNGASVCGKHHLECEMTLLSVEEVRAAAGIQHVVVPDQFYPDHRYDKWGNHILINGQRTKGPLFEDESVQKILTKGGVLDRFTDYVKYPRTFHLPWSECVHSDDKVTKWLDNFTGKKVVVTEKLDGENTSLYSNKYHARSVDSKNHESRNWAKNFWSKISWEIPERWRLCCENMFMEHSIPYGNLESYLYGLSIWDETNTCLPWEETKEYFSMLGIPQPRVMYEGVWDEETIQNLYDSDRDWETCEGYVVRLRESFHYRDFHKSVAKFVRKDHIQTVKHCLLAHSIKQNQLHK